MSPHWRQRRTQQVEQPLSLSRSIHISCCKYPLQRAQFCQSHSLAVAPAVLERIVPMCTSSSVCSLMSVKCPDATPQAIQAQSTLDGLAVVLAISLVCTVACRGPTQAKRTRKAGERDGARNSELRTSDCEHTRRCENQGGLKFQVQQGNTGSGTWLEEQRDSTSIPLMEA